MTQVAILLLCMATAPPVAGRVVSGPGLRPGQAIGRSHVVRAPTRSGPVTLLTTGGCLVHLSAGAAVTLGPPTKNSGCSTVRVIQGRVRLGAPARKSTQPALTVVLGKHTMTFTGEGLVRHGAVSGLCVNHGRLRLIISPKPTPSLSPSPSPTPTPTPTPTPSPTPSPPSIAGAGQCLWLTASGATLGAYKTAAAARDQKYTATTYGFTTPSVAVTVDLKKELASLSAALHSGSGGGSDVDGGGQSMCLDTGGEGSAADLGSSAVEVTKPPPPTQLRLLLDLKRRTP